MESSEGTSEIVKPIILKAGIPLTVALAGFLLAKVVTRKLHVPSLSSEAVSTRETGFSSRDEDNEIDGRCELQQELSLLRSRIEDIQDREYRLETRFICYQHLKDQEMLLVEHQNKLLMELNKVELFKKEISLLSAEIHMFEHMVTENSKVSGLLQVSRTGNRMLRKKVEKLLRVNRDKSRVLRKRNSQLEAKEMEILRNREEVDVKNDCLKKMEDEIKELRLTTEILKVENNKLLHDLDRAEKSTTQEAEKETIPKENYEATENYYEVMYLRRCNAFLRHELGRKNQEREDNQIHDDHNHLDRNTRQITETEEFGSDNEVDRFAPDGQTQVHVHGRRRKLIEKLKKWVEGVEITNPNLTEKEKHENKCFRRHSVSASKELSLPARNSCSSA